MCAPSIRGMNRAIQLKEQLKEEFWRRYTFIQEGCQKIYDAYGEDKYREWEKSTISKAQTQNDIYIFVKDELDHISSVAQNEGNGA